MKRWKSLLLAGSVAMVSVVVIFCGRSTHEPPPNILLITVCSLRQDHLGFYGYRRATSPHLDALAESATVFSNAYTHVPWTKPSTIALMTGRYPIPRPARESLPQLLQAQGYATYGIIGTNMVRKAAQMDKGFDGFQDHQDLETGHDSATVPANIIVDTGLKVLADHDSERRPIFLWLFFKDPHWPYLPPEPFLEKFINDDFYGEHREQLKINDDWAQSIGGLGKARITKDGKKAVRNNKKNVYLTEKADYIARYDAEIAFMDSQLGRLLSSLHDSGEYDDWLIAFSADHGESHGEDNYYFDHGYSLFDADSKIPLVVKFPGQTRPVRRPEVASIADIYHTIAEVAGATYPPLPPSDLDGRSLSARTLDDGERMIVLENQPAITNQPNWERFVAVIDDSYKLVLNLSKNTQTSYRIDAGGRYAELDGPIQLPRHVESRMRDHIRLFKIDEKIDREATVKELRSLGYLQ